MVVLARVPADEDLGLPRGDLARELANVVGMHFTDRGRLLGIVVFEMPAQSGEDGLHLHRLKVLQHHAEAALEGGIDAGRRQRMTRCRSETVGE